MSEILYTSPEQDFLDRLNREKEVARSFVERRQENWNDNYELYRNKVKTNRLTQRQAVNVPLMKETIKTLLSKIDDPPVVTWKELGGDREKEIYLQEKWNNDFEKLNFEGIDIQDKKTALLYGRSFKKLNFADKEFSVYALDIFDIVIDPIVDPLDIETARFLIHQNIFKTLRQILADARYSEEAKNELKKYLTSSEAIIQSGENKDELELKQERLLAMGVEKDDFENFSAGDVLFNLNEHFTKIWTPKKKKFEWYVVDYANDKVILLKKPLEELLGIDFLPFTSWGEDIETQDIWSDGPGDLVRTPNKILNVWFSQMLENRTLKNFQMHWYDSTIQGYQPQTYEPGPGRMLPAPGKPNEVIKPVEVSGLEDTLTQIDFLIKLIERGTAATAIEKGVSEKKQITLGEVEMLVGKAMERTLAMAKFYRRSWQELAMKWYKLRDANESNNNKVTLYKTSAKGKIWPKDIYGSDWKSKKGFKAVVQSSSEQEEEKTKGMQRLFFIKGQFPDNPALSKIIQKRALELVDLTPEEIREVEEYEKKRMEMMAQPTQPPAVGGELEEETLTQGIQARTKELAGLTARI